MTPTDRSLLLKLLDDAFEKKTWHGPNLKGSLRGLSAEEAAWRPYPHRHNIWEIAVHPAYWKYTVRRRLLGEKRGSFSLNGSNWFVLPVHATDADWKAHIHLLDETHRSMRDAVAGMNPTRLFARLPHSKHTAAEIISGIAYHDVYHAGQIQLLKRMMQRR